MKQKTDTFKPKRRTEQKIKIYIGLLLLIDEDTLTRTTRKEATQIVLLETCHIRALNSRQRSPAVGSGSVYEGQLARVCFIALINVNTAELRWNASRTSGIN